MAAVVLPLSAQATVYDPVGDGSFYDCGGCVGPSDGAYVLASGYIYGIVKFTNTSALRNAADVELTLNPYGLPLFGPNLSIYGFVSSVPTLDVTDNSGLVLIGDFVLPDLGYGEDGYFAVTDFVRKASGPYIGFSIHSDGTDVFSSIEYNYGHPSQLIAQIGAVPEPASWAMAIVGVGLVGAAARRRRPELATATAQTA